MKTFRFITLCLVTASTSAFAQSADTPSTSNAPKNDWSGFIAVGPGAVPKYDGARKYELVPFVTVNIKYRNITFEAFGLGAKLDVLSEFTGGSVFGGPAFALHLGRNSKNTTGAVKLLDKIKTQAEGGGFIGYKLGGNEYGEGQVKLEVSALGNSKGFQTGAELTWQAVRTRAFFVDVDSSLNFASAKYMRTYFGVTPAESLASGIAAYRPKGGLRDIGSDITVGYRFTSSWGVVANAGINYLVGDAGKSPIVNGIDPVLLKKTGSRLQAFSGIGVFYKF